MASSSSVAVGEPGQASASSQSGQDGLGHNAGTDIEAEVEALKSKHGVNCKVIHNVGIFTHIVSAQLQHKDLTVKFQIEESYPETAPSFGVISGQMSMEDCQCLHDYLVQEVADLVGTAMMDPVVNLTLAWLEDRCLDLTIKESKNNNSAKSHRKQSSKPKKKTKNHNKEDDTEGKKPSMKTAEDVISRIMWDDDLPSDCFTVGYMDRFVGIVEESFTALSWDNIASVDYNTLVIPKHRIQYFKYKDVKFWDKKLRMDNMFGSTGSGLTITNVISQWEHDHPYVMPVQQSWSDDDDDESDEDNIVIHTGCQEQDQEQDTVEADCSISEDPYWGAKVRPTHFLALRITHPAILAAMAEAHTACTETEPAYEDFIIPTERLHVTLACLGLDTEEQIQQAVDVLNKLKPELLQHDPLNITIQFEDVGNFFHCVLYARVKENPKFMEFVEHLKLCLTEAGINLRDVFEFNPHMTVLKLKKQQARGMHSPYLDPRLYVQLEGKVFGSQALDNIHLCTMSEVRKQDGFYRCPTSIHFD